MRRPRAILFLALAMLALPATACSPKAIDPIIASAREASNAAALAIENTEAMALVLYRIEQEAVLTKAVAAHWTEDQAKAELVKVRASWQPVRDTLQLVRTAHEALRAAVLAARTAEAAGERPDIGSVLEASSKLADAEVAAAKLIAAVRARLDS